MDPFSIYKVVSVLFQGCALTAPGRLRRLTFGFGRVRKTTQSPGRALWLIAFLADKAGKNFNMLVVTVYETSEKMFFSSYETVGSKAVPHDFTCNIICDFARDGRLPHEFRFFLKKIHIKFGTWSLAFLGYSLKKELLLLL